jgi:hypothetical protein
MDSPTSCAQALKPETLSEALAAFRPKITDADFFWDHRWPREGVKEALKNLAEVLNDCQKNRK